MGVDEFAAIARLIDALRPWLDRVVIVGGWAHRLFRFHPLANPPRYAALRTKDADIAFSTDATIEGDIAAALKAMGFQEEISNWDTPPITKYHLDAAEGGFYAEFLVPLHGSGVRRDGEPDATMEKAGVTAQKLRHLQLLLVKPWPVQMGEEVSVPLQPPVELLLPNPVTFIAQKLLIQKYRTPVKKAQDALYIHDTLELFGAELPTLGALWDSDIRPTLHQKAARAVERSSRQRFGAVDDVIRNAVRLPQDRTLQPERFRATCLYGLEEIYGKLT